MSDNLIDIDDYQIEFLFLEFNQNLFVQLINDLHRSLLGQQELTTAQLEQRLELLVARVCPHLDLEAEFMLRCNYPASGEQFDAHHVFSAELHATIQELHEHRVILRTRTLKWLFRFLEDHILVADKAFVDWFRRERR